MMTKNLGLNRFLGTWIAEFSRAVEMFSGLAPEIRQTQMNSASVPQSESCFWIKQVFAGDSSTFTTWIGAPKLTWTHLGASLGEGAPEALQSTYLEILNQAQQGSASVVSSGSSNALRCEKPTVLEAAPAFESTDAAIFEIELVGAGVPSLCFVIETLADKALEAYRSEVQQAVAADALEDSPYSSLDGVLNLKLPVAVSLGHSRLEMKKLLQAGPGSVIGLNKETGEPVELLIQGKVVALGQIVLVKGNYGLRIIQIVDRQDRLQMCNS